jgi:putative FmdB family regulatory protein
VPTYQYACTECGEQLEAVQSFSDPALTECPNCQGKLRKVFNSVGIVFKGSGFYRNDSRSGNVGVEKPGTEKSGAEKPSSTGEAPAKKTETAPAASTSGSSSTTSGSSSSSTSSPSTGGSGAKAAAAS